MSQSNIRKILDQFSAEGAEGDWHHILQEALKELEELEKNDKVLAALNQGGVDNWEFYGEAIQGLTW